MNRVLVISNNPFSKTDSNGRTLGNFFLGWDKTCLAQFYIRNAKPDFEYCENFFRVTDAEALRAFKKGKCAGGIVLPSTNTKEAEATVSKPQKAMRTALTMLARDLVWRTGRWQSCGFWDWVKEFSPNIVLLQAGDCPFMYRLAVKVAKKQKAKLVIYNSEGYYFKKFDYFRAHGIAHLLYPLFRQSLKRALKKAYRRASHIVYLCDELKRSYDQKFSAPSTTVYTASDILARKAAPQNEVFTTAYCGNLGLERHLRLIEIAEALREISPELSLDVYGPTADEKVLADLAASPAVRYHGRVSYEEVLKVLAQSDLILHTESFDPFYREDLKFAFSTKIADSLSSGTCFLLYAPENLACTKYLSEHEAAYVVTKKEDLPATLSLLVRDATAREKYISRALALAEKNHRAEKNEETFQSILRNL